MCNDFAMAVIIYQVSLLEISAFSSVQLIHSIQSKIRCNHKNSTTNGVYK